MRAGQRFNPHRMFTGIFIPDAVYRHPGLTPTAKLLYGRLCRYAGEQGEAYPAATTLAAEIHLSERQVFEHLAHLVTERFIDREPRAGTSTVYHFLWHPCFESDGYEVVRKSALLGEIPDCGNPHGGSAEIRTTGSAEILTLRESIEESQGRELNAPDPAPPFEGKNSTHCSRPPDLEADEEAPPTARRRWSRKPPKPETPSQQFRRMARESGMLNARASEEKGAAVTHAESPPMQPAAPERDYAGIWNEIVHPSTPVSRESYASVVRKIRGIPELDNQFEAVCQKAAELLAKDPDQVGFINFGWIVRANQQSGVPNWRSLLDGAYDWMTVRDKGKKGKDMSWLDQYRPKSGT